MFNNVKWIFFDVGSTIVDEHLAYEHRMKEIADLSGETYKNVYRMAVDFYRQNKKGDLCVAKKFGIELPKWHAEDELLYEEAKDCLEFLSGKYKIGIIANQAPGTKERLEKYGILNFGNASFNGQVTGIMGCTVQVAYDPSKPQKGKVVGF